MASRVQHLHISTADLSIIYSRDVSDYCLLIGASLVPLVHSQSGLSGRVLREVQSLAGTLQCCGQGCTTRVHTGGLSHTQSLPALCEGPGEHLPQVLNERTLMPTSSGHDCTVRALVFWAGPFVLLPPAPPTPHRCDKNMLLQLMLFLCLTCEPLVQLSTYRLW